MYTVLKNAGYYKITVFNFSYFNVIQVNVMYMEVRAI